MSAEDVPWLKRGSTWLVVGSLLLAGFSIYLGSVPKENKLATSILQGCALLLGIVGSFVGGRDASKNAAREVIRPHARSAFRRVQNLYRALGRQRDAIAVVQQNLGDAAAGTGDEKQVPLDFALTQLQGLQWMVVEQISTADDALEDWRDLVPDEVAAIELEARKRDGSDA